MTRFLALALLPALLVTGCMPATVHRGAVEVCTDAAVGGDDLDLEISGTVSALGEPVGDCAVTLTVEDDQGARTSFGLSVSDDHGGDVTPELQVAVGDAIDLTYRYRMVWGSVAGLVILDGDGIVVGAEEGSWGGALEAGDVPGLEVTRGDEPVAVEPADCQPIEGFELVFHADEVVALEPVRSEDVEVDGGMVTVWAIAAYDLGKSRSCHVSDATGVDAWVVHR